MNFHLFSLLVVLVLAAPCLSEETEAPADGTTVASEDGTTAGADGSTAASADGTTEAVEEDSTEGDSVSFSNNMQKC